MIQSPHGIKVDPDGNIWVVDCSCTAGGGGRGRGGAGGGGGGGRGGDTTAAQPIRTVPTQGTEGHQIYKFSPEGKLLMTIGRAGGGRDPEFFTTPNAILFAKNGDFFVAEGHSSVQGQSPARVLKFDKGGKLLGSWGTVFDSTKINEPYAFNQPHALAMDSKGRLFVGDRGYNRIKIFDQNMKLLETWYQFSRPSGIWIDDKDNIYVADSESGSVNPAHWEWARGIRVGKIGDGKVMAFIPDPLLTCGTRLPATVPDAVKGPAGACANNTSAAEGIAVDRNGVIYGAEVGPRALKRYEKK
jgi:DNA-binding beta-propeller fold protein YncE